MRNLLSQLQTRLILGALAFLLGLTGAVILVVRDSLLFSARNMTEVGAQALLEQRQTSLVEIARREAESSDHAIHHDPSDLRPLNGRLRALALTPNSFAFVLDGEGKLIADPTNNVGKLISEEITSSDTSATGLSLIESSDSDLREILLRMQAGETGVDQMIIGDEPAIIAYAPLVEMGWSLAIVEPVADIIVSAEPLVQEVQSTVDGILQASLKTIGYFAVVAIVGAIIAARALIKPIQAMVKGTRSIASGDLTVRLPVSSNDELGTLADSFNRMADSLQTRTQELMEANRAAIENAREVEQTRTLAAVEERQRLARDLHDSAAQSLYSLTLLAEASRRNIASGEIEKVKEQITRLGEMAQQTLKEMRLLVYQLRPMELETDNLVDAIRHRLDAVEKRSGVNAQLHVNLDANIPAGMESNLFRIAQEALNNVLKHAEATVITVTLNGGSQFVELEIVDNGIGFDPMAINDQGGMGMGNIRERTETLGGQFSITSQPGNGTRLWVQVPLTGLASEIGGGSNDS